MNRDTVNFQRFKKLIEKYVLNPVDIDDIHDLYIEYKQGIRKYDSSPTEFIVNRFNEQTIDKHGNCLKRNKEKK